MGEVQGSKFELDFNRSVKVEFSDQRITSKAGVLLLREADFKLELMGAGLFSLAHPFYPLLAFKKIPAHT